MKKIVLLFATVAFFTLHGNAQQPGAAPYTLTVTPISIQKIQTPVTPLTQFPLKSNSTNRLINTYATTQFGSDIIIQQDTTSDQRHVKVATAFNGWIYTAFTRDVMGNEGLTIRRSTDGGLTWSNMLSSVISSGVDYPAIDLAVAGNDTNNLFIFLAGVTHDQSTGTYSVWLERFNGTSGTFLDQHINESNGTNKIYDVALATDYRRPAYNASPFSVAMIYSKLSSYDSVIYLSSIDGGATYNTREGIYSTISFCGKVTIAFGTCAYYSNGRYFVAFESRSTSNSNVGHVLFTHTVSDPTSAFQPLIYIDSLTTSTPSKLGNPRIACSNLASNNDSSSLTSIVTVNQYYNAVDYDILGFYSLTAVHSTSSNWHVGSLAASSDLEIENDIAFNDSDQFFYATFFDSTLHQLVSSKTGYNNGTGWTVQNTQYNDQTNNVVQPYPRLSIDPVSATANYVWNSQNSSGRGIALFDAENSLTGIPLAENVYDFLSPYPNPSDGMINFKYTLNTNERVQLSIINILGQEVIPATESGIQSAGMHNLPVDFSDLPNGVYVYRFVAGRETKTGNLVIAH